MIKDFKDLKVWQKSRKLVCEIYSITKNFPKEEVFGLTQQMRRCTISIPSNIAEGWMRQYRKEYIQFIHHSLGSCGELETQIIIAADLHYIDKDIRNTCTEELTIIVKMLRALLKGLRK